MSEASVPGCFVLQNIFFLFFFIFIFFSVCHGRERKSMCSHESECKRNKKIFFFVCVCRGVIFGGEKMRIL